MTPKLRWVAPPNWPDVPAGFEPPEGWQPDPSWPAPPADWQFWQRDGVDVHTGLSRWQRSRRTWVGTVVTLGFLAVLLILLIGVSWHHHSSKINTEKLDHDIETSMRKTLESTNPVANCPSGESAKKGNEFLCDISDSSGSGHADVTVINDNGDVRWEFSQ